MIIKTPYNFQNRKRSNLIDQNRRMRAVVGLDQLGGIVGLAGFDTSKVSGKGFLTPRTLGGVADGGEGGNGSEGSRVFQVRHKSTVTSHRVSGDRFPSVKKHN